MKKRLSPIFLTLSMVLVLLMLSGCGSGKGVDTWQQPVQLSVREVQPKQNPAPEPAKEKDSEIQKAIELGIVPKSLQGRNGEQITYGEFSKLLDGFMTRLFPEKLNDWKKASALYREAKNPMCRMEGALVFLYAAECAGVDTEGYQNNVPLEDLMSEHGGDFWKGVTWDYPLLPDRDRIYQNEKLSSNGYGWRCEHPYYNNAVWFVEYLSYGNGRTYFDFDKDYSLRLGDPFTCGEAIRAVERLYETARFTIYVPAEKAGSHITKETLTLAASMPETAYDHLPDWKGHTILNRLESINSGGSMKFTEEEVSAVASCGFNFTRIPLDARLLFAAGGTDPSRINAAYLETMDDLVNWCAQYGIHVCFDLHDMPGFYTGGYDDSRDILFWDKDSQTLLREFWAFLADHYKNVPSNLLSFNLLNEPHSNGTDELTDELYSSVMLPVIEAIRKISPDRLIFVDMLGVTRGRPVEGLADAKVAQAAHPYFLADYASDWPAVYINGILSKDKGDLTVNGTFPEGTEVSVSISMAHASGKLTLLADSKTADALPLGGEPEGEGGCAAILEKGTSGEYRRYEAGKKVLTFSVKSPSKKLQLKQSGAGRWYRVDNIKIKTPDWEITLLANDNYALNDTSPVLTITKDGAATAKNAETLLILDKAVLKELFQEYSDFTKRTGEQVMIQEFGFNYTIPLKTALAAAEDFFSVLDGYKIPWCCWSTDFGVITPEESQYDIIPVHTDGTYETITSGWRVFKEMLEVYQRHMVINQAS